MLEVFEVVVRNEHGLNLSVASQLDARTGGRSADDARQILARQRGWNLLDHAAKLDSIGARSTFAASGIHVRRKTL